MTRPAPHTVAPSTLFPSLPAGARDPRLKHRLPSWDGGPADALILGVPFDHGVVLGHGRPGAAEGPAALRRAILRFGTTYDIARAIDWDGLRLGDAGDVDVAAEDVDATHGRLTAAAGAILDAGAALVVIGGGNDASFASVRALAGRAAAVGGVNIDAHLDVREVQGGRITSGTPFRRVIEELGVPGERFVELGAHPNVNTREHHEWLQLKRSRCHPLPALRARGAGEVLRQELDVLAGSCDALFVSIDLDVFAAAYAPGVSAPGTVGLTPEEGEAMAFEAGASPRVRLFELMELCPRHDVDDRTARLAAMLLCAFFAGLADRRRRG